MTTQFTHQRMHYLLTWLKALIYIKVVPLQGRCGPEVGTGIALLFLDHDTRRGWVVSSTLRQHFTHGKEPVPILQEAGWAPGSVWTGRKCPHRDSIPDRPARSHPLYRVSYPANLIYVKIRNNIVPTSFVSLMTIIWELYVYLTEVIFMLKPSVK